jgi:hypothetical protein
MTINLNDAGEQRSLEPIPAGQVVRCAVKIRPGGIGQGGWLHQATTEKGTSENLDLEFTVIDGPYKGRKIWAKYTLSGSSPKHAEAAEISHQTLRAMIESGKGIKSNDKSEAAATARNIEGWHELNGIVVTIKTGVIPAHGQYSAKNTISYVLTPENNQWAAPTAEEAAAAAAAATVNTAAPAATTTAAPAAVATPEWAK